MGGGNHTRPRVRVSRSSIDPNRVYMDFDAAAPGGKGGASILYEPIIDLVSIDGVHKNVSMPPRSTGALLADGLQQLGFHSPAMIEMYNVVEWKTVAVLRSGKNGQGTRMGHLLENTVSALGGVVVGWEPIRTGAVWHLRIHVEYPGSEEST